MNKIAVIEDNHEMRENIQEILELADYNVVTAKDGKEGVELVKREKPDLIICDIMMPELDGYGVLYYLSKSSETSHIPFIFLSAKAERSDWRKGMNMGADDYLTKPFEEMELLSAVESRIAKSQRFQTIQNLDDKWDGFKTALHDFSKMEKLLETSNTREFLRKEIVYEEGDVPKFLFYVEKGHVRNYKMTKDGKELATDIYKTGDFFGYTELLTGENYLEFSTAMEDSLLTLVPKDDFERLLLSDKDVSASFIKLLAGSIVERENALLNLAYNTVRKRVAEALVKLYDKYVKEHQYTLEIIVSRDELASIVGTATESVIRILSEFKNDGSILSKGSTITILDIEALRNCKF
jgi:CRP-like cAMP-binding protein